MPSYNQPQFKTSNIYFFLALLILVGSVAYGAVQYKLLNAERQAIIDSQSTQLQLNGSLDKAQTAYKTLADDRAKKQQDFSKKIASILPADENYTDVTRLIDDYVAENDRPGNSILESSLRFGKGAPVSDVPSVSALPMSMNIEATRDNFFKFLNFVWNSGSLDSGARLMDINSIQLNFPGEGEVIKDPQQKINFTIDMNAYYQTPKVAR